MMIKRLKSKSNRSKRGQSFLELMVVLLILMLLFAGIVEYGFMINNYIHVLDGSREAARTYNSYKAFNHTTQISDDEFFFFAAEQAAITMDPVRLDPDLGDDIIISVISVRGTEIRRFPLQADNVTSGNGWSLCANYADYLIYSHNHGRAPLAQLDAEGWTHCPAHNSRLNESDITSRAGENAMQSGLLVVEVLYNYPQLLKLPLLAGAEFFGTKYAIIPDPIPLYIYTVMPMSSAEPTEIP